MALDRLELGPEHREDLQNVSFTKLGTADRVNRTSLFCLEASSFSFEGGFAGGGDVAVFSVCELVDCSPARGMAAKPQLIHVPTQQVCTLARDQKVGQTAIDIRCSQLQMQLKVMKDTRVEEDEKQKVQ